jgi:outer membrane receptor protein involved in Fe transport
VITSVALLLSANVAFADGTVRGVVLDADTGVPTEGAIVRVVEAGKSGRSDADGVFKFDAPAGEWTVEVEAEGRTVTVGRFRVVDGAATEVLVSVAASGPPIVSIEEPPASVGAQDANVPLFEVRGTIVGEDGEPIAGARVFARGQTSEGKSDEAGVFVMQLPAGEHDLSVLRSGYVTTSIPPLAVDADGSYPPVQVQLLEAGVALAPFEVRAPRIVGGTSSLLEERRDASTVSDTLGAEQMTKAGDSDAASAMRRVTGITVVGGRYVYVRGLGDRYSSTLLNGSSLPSPEPEKRVVPLDMFPTSIIESVTIQKTFSPDKPAEFGGGIVQIQTRTVPPERVLSIGGSVGYRQGTTFQNATTGARSSTDFLGFGLNDRELPQIVQDEAGDQPIRAQGLFSDGGFPPEKLEEFGESFSNEGWERNTTTIPPDFTLQAQWGDSVKLGGGPRIGALLNTNWDNAWNLTEAERNTYGVSGEEEVVLLRSSDYDALENRIVLGGLATVGAEWEDASKVSTTFFINRVAEYAAVEWFADDPTSTSDTVNNRTDWVEQQLLMQQFVGTHPLFSDHLTFDWRYTYSQADRKEPDRREAQYLYTPDGPYISQIGTWNEMAFYELRDINHDGGADLTFAVNPDAEQVTTFKLGAAGINRKRDSGTRRFTYEFNGTEGIDLSAPPEDIFVPENIGEDEENDPAYLEMHEVTTSSDDYVATQKLRAGYLMADLGLGRRLRLMGGARVEDSEQVVSTFELYNPALVPVEARLKTTDVLPALTATYAIGPREEPDRMLVRAGYGKTVSRPEFRELSSVPFTDFLSGALLFGNPDLERATIDNLDVRWELYPSPSESMSFAAFYKNFHDPIERVAQSSAVSGLAYTFGNANGATNLGIELDTRVTFGRITDTLRDLFLAVNGSLIYSEIDLTGSVADTSQTRPLQGQSPWVINVQLGYDNPESRVSVAVLYNAFGPRITDVGQSGIPDTYELPVHRLDATALFPLAKAWVMRLKATNLLDAAAIEMTGDGIAEITRDGRAFSLGILWRPPAPEKKKNP